MKHIYSKSNVAFPVYLMTFDLVFYWKIKGHGVNSGRYEIYHACYGNSIHKSHDKLYDLSAYLMTFHMIYILVSFSFWCA